MIIDFHTHIFPDSIAPKTIPVLEKRSGIRPSTNGMAEGLAASMENADVVLSVVMPVVTKPSQFDSINAFAGDVNEKYAGRLLSFGGIHPDCEDYKGKLKFIKDCGFKGIKLHPDYQGVMIDDIRYMRIIEFASELDLIILTHAGIDIGLPDPVCCPPDRLRFVLDKIKPQKFVAAHMGGWKQWELVYEYLAGENLYFDTAFTLDFIDTEMFLKLLEKHGSDRILFATDSPWGNVSRNIEQINSLQLDADTREKIFWKNARKLLEN